MNQKEIELLQEETGEEIEPRLSLCSQTKVDTGRWLGSTPLWVAVSSDELFILAAGKRPYFERVSLQDCEETHYNAATGEIIIAPTEGLICNQLAFSSTDAIELLKTLGIEESQWTHKVSQEPIIPQIPSPKISAPEVPTPEETENKSPPKTSKFAKYKAQKNQ